MPCVGLSQSIETTMHAAMSLGVVSVVIPTRNRSALLAETLGSIRAQTYPHWEVIVVDDDSEDRTVEMVRALARSDSRFRVLQSPGPSRGAPACRNDGLEASTGEFVVFFDSDDLMHRDCLGGRVALMQSDPDLDFGVFHGELFATEPGDIGVLCNALSTAPDLPRFLCEDAPWLTPGPIWRRRFFASSRLRWDTRAINWQDWEFHVRALLQRPLYTKVARSDHYVRRSAEDAHAISSDSHHRDKLSDRLSTYVRIAVELQRGERAVQGNSRVPSSYLITRPSTSSPDTPMRGRHWRNGGWPGRIG